MRFPLLYSYRRCPYAMRARLALLLAGHRFQVFEIVLRDKPAGLLALSPKGTVPVLHLPDGRVLDESLHIMAWALGPCDRQDVWVRAQSDKNLALLACNDGPFKQQLDRYKYPDRDCGELSSREEARALATSSLLLPLEGQLRNQPFLGGASACATDLAIFPFVRQFAAVQPDWFAQQSLPAVHAWLQTWLGSSLFQTCMSKLPSQTVTTFPTLAAD